MGFVFLGKVGKVKQNQKKKTAVRKSLETLLLDWKMAPGTSSGERKEGKARHTHTQPHQLVSSYEPFSCKHSLFLRTESGSKHKRYVIVNTCYDDDTDNRSNINLISLKKRKEKKGSTGLGNSVQGPLTFTIPVKMLQLQTTRCCWFLLNSSIFEFFFQVFLLFI